MREAARASAEYEALGVVKITRMMAIATPPMGRLIQKLFGVDQLGSARPGLHSIKITDNTQDKRSLVPPTPTWSIRECTPKQRPNNARNTIRGAHDTRVSGSLRWVHNESNYRV